MRASIRPSTPIISTLAHRLQRRALPRCTRLGNNELVKHAVVLALALLLGACNRIGAVVTVDSSAPLGAVSRLRARVTNNGQSSADVVIVPSGPPFSIPPVRKFELTFAADRTGSAQLTVDAEDGTGAVLARGTSPFDIPAGNEVDVPVHLGGPPGGGDGGMYTCSDGVLDGDETDVDCGGSCLPCAADKTCARDTDCTTRSCDTNHQCALVSAPPFWRPVAHMLTPRSNLAAVQATDGRLYALGGFYQNAAPSPLRSAEVYNAFTGQWTPIMQMGTNRSGPAAAPLADGRIAVAGGSTPTGVVGSTEYYASTGDAWAGGNDLTTARTAGAMVQLGDGRLLAIGGSMLASIDVSTPGSAPGGGTWTAFSPPLPFDLQFQAALIGADGRAYVLGGQRNSAPAVDAEAVVETFAPGATMWTNSVAPMPTGRNSLAAALAADGRIYAIAGEVAANPPVDVGVVEAWSPATNRWASLPAVTPRARLAAALAADGRVYALGGSYGGSTEKDLVEAYGPVFQLDLAQASAGATVSVKQGDNFAANATVSFSLVHAGTTTPIGSGTTDAQGVLATPVALGLPSVPAGSYVVRAVDNRSLYPVVRPLQVQ